MCAHRHHFACKRRILLQLLCSSSSRKKKIIIVFFSVPGQQLQEYVVHDNKDDANLKTCTADYVLVCTFISHSLRGQYTLKSCPSLSVLFALVQRTCTQHFVNRVTSQNSYGCEVMSRWLRGWCESLGILPYKQNVQRFYVSVPLQCFQE